MRVKPTSPTNTTQTNATPTNAKNKTNPQNLTSFPNQNEKHIDYVIYYEKLDDVDVNDSDSLKKDTARKAFFAALKAENIDVYEIEEKQDEKTFIFALLHCSIERLLEEAELTRHEMVLKNVNIQETKINLIGIKESFFFKKWGFSFFFKPVVLRLT